MEGLIIYTGCLNSNQIVWGWRVWVGAGLPSEDRHLEPRKQAAGR